LIARHIDHFEWIRRNSGRAQVLRALIAIDRFVCTIRILDDGAQPIAFDDFAILARLSAWHVGTNGGVAITADLVDTRTCLAKIVHSYALSRFIASNAIADSIADLIGTAYEVLGFERIGRHAIGANVFRARLIVDRNVGIEVFTLSVARSITDDTLTIAKHLSWRRRREGSHSREGLSTRVIDTRAFTAISVRG